MIYKAKPSYKKLKDSENYNHFGSPVKHYKLLNDEARLMSLSDSANPNPSISSNFFFFSFRRIFYITINSHPREFFSLKKSMD